MKKLIIITVLAFSGYLASAQQMPFFSQYMFNQYTLNPAVAGSTPNMEAGLMFRNQWTGFADSPKTQLITMHGTIAPNMGIGGMMFNDVTGPVSRAGMQLSYAYHIKANDDAKISFALAGLLYQQSLNASALTTDQPSDRAIQGDQSNFFPEATFGVYYYAPKYYAGLSMPQLFQWETSFGDEGMTERYKMVRHYFLTGGYKIELNGDFELEPSANIKMIEAAPMQFDINVKAYYKKMVWLGFSYRDRESIVSLLGVHLDKFKVGYAYDFTLTDIGSYSFGSHEVYLAMTIPTKKGRGRSSSRSFR